MEKQKRWQFFVIVAVVALTLYNILPTIIYYSKPLHAPVDQKAATEVAKNISVRVHSLLDESIEWVGSFCDLLHVKPTSIKAQASDPSIIQVKFPDAKQAELFARFLPRAGSLIPFVPAQLALAQEPSKDNTVLVLRNIGVDLDPKEYPQLFRYTTKEDKNGNVSDFYFDLVADRFSVIANTLGGTSPMYEQMVEVLQATGDQNLALVQMAKQILRVAETFGDSSSIAKRYFGTLTQTEAPDASSVLQRFIAKMDEAKRSIELKKLAIQEERKAKEAKGELIDVGQLEQLDQLKQQEQILTSASDLLKKHKDDCEAGIKPLTKKQVAAWLAEQRKKNPSSESRVILPLGKKSLLINALALDWASDDITLIVHSDVKAIQKQSGSTELTKIQQEEVNRLLMNELARLTQVTDENVVQGLAEYRINLSSLPQTQSLLALDLRKVAEKIAKNTLSEIKSGWKPTHIDLARDKLPVFNADEYKAADASQKRLCLLVTVPTAKETLLPGLRQGSVYVVMRGVQSIIDQYHRFPESKEAKMFGEEIQELAKMLQQRGFIGYAGSSFDVSPELARDFVFELDDYYTPLLAATRESFNVLGTKQFATLEFSDVEQRIATENEIEDAIQEDLLRSKEAYAAAQVSLDPLAKYFVPAPRQNAYWDNFKRSMRAYFRGDNSKVLRWGLDLSGGKSVRVALTDHAGRQVTNPDDLHQAVNELYTRINKMGVSDRTIRIENSTILIDFPGAQGLTASELVKASAMYFHIVNEQFGPYNAALAKDVNEFLQDVWNEAVVTNQKDDIEKINEIAYNKLQLAASRLQQGKTLGVKSSAEILYEAGLRLVNKETQEISGAFDDTVSMIARFRDDVAESHLHSQPLIITFANYALEGSSLENVHTAYDQSKGNILSFEVKGSYTGKRALSGANPRDDFYAWTSQFSEEKIIGTTREAVSNGRGWRMAVILNDSVITAPSLNAALREHAMISGNFTQREVNKLATDLKAGSLSFTPKILSEQNISPDLGMKERQSGIIASVVGVLLVIAVMCSYYRFAGLVACVAVLFNVLVIWAVMQNIEMALTLPGIAGIVLTVAMAVDANVLVFERTREEFKISGRIASALQIGYKKAFSAIVDSNITTLIAALILLQFDSGPVRGFAVTLVIGIVSSMFTSLFMTRYFFAGWVQNPKNKRLDMAEWIQSPNYNFLKYTKPAFILSAILLVAGLGVLAKEWKSIFGMDFTGGYALVVDLQEKPATAMSNDSYRDMAKKALAAKGLSSGEYLIRELGRPNLLRIQLGVSLEQPGQPFYGMPLELSESEVKAAFDYQRNPRIVWLVETLKSGGLEVKPADLPQLGASWTHMSGQFSDAMRNNAIIALTLSLFAVLVYIAIRFEWKFAVASVLALLHDVLLTISVLAIGHSIGMPLQIDLEVVGAIMTIIGYSLNDTIIVFDRVREDMRIMRKKSFKEIINHALNTTLSRTLMTSSTTLLVLLALVFLGGSSIFTFAFVMAMGVFLGTLSSLYIAAPILLYLEDKSTKSALQQSHG